MLSQFITLEIDIPFKILVNFIGVYTTSTPNDKHIFPISELGVTPRKQLEKENIYIYMACEH